MLNDNEFIERVWSKYEVYSKRQDMKKDKFFTGKLYRNVHNMLVLKTCALFMLVVIATALIGGGTYAVINDIVNQKAYTEEKIVNEKDKSFFLEGKTNFWNKDGLIYEDYMHYRKINTYDEYLEFCGEFDNIPKMTENDFNDYFLIIVVGGFSRNGLFIDNIETTEDTLKINLKSNGRNDYKYICDKISRNMERDKIKIEYIDKFPIMPGYINMNEIPYNYTREQAIADGCVVLDEGKYLSKPDGLKEFFHKTEEGINGSIRVVEYGVVYERDDNMQNLDGMCITDVEFRDGKYIVCSDRSREVVKTENNDEEYKIYFTSNKQAEFIVCKDGEPRGVIGNKKILADEEYKIYATDDNKGCYIIFMLKK